MRWSPVCFRTCATGLLAALSACTTYQALPLARQPSKGDTADIRVDPATLPTQSLTRHRYDPDDGLDITETAMLAVANNPQLKVRRDQLGIAHAQAFAAGLLPDPQLNWSQDFVTGNSGGPDAVSPFGFGISYDVSKLLTYSTRTHAAQWNEKQIDLDLLWAEWQTVAQARQLFVHVRYDRVTVSRLQAEVAALTPLGRDVEAALKAGILGYDLASSGLGATADARQKLTDATTQLDQDEHALRQLLGLSPQAPLRLTGPLQVAIPDADAVDRALTDLPRRRPDLLALQAGYASENQKLREAILAQFPAINVGFNRARDNSAVYTSGYSISLTLPLFDRNRGNIAIERATRQQLHDDYSARLLGTGNDVDRLRRQLALDRAALPAARAHAATLDAALKHAARAWQSHQLDLPVYLNIRSNALAADTGLTTLRQTTTDTAIALQTLLGADWSSRARNVMQADRVPPSETQGP